MSKKNRPHGHYCKICGEYKANEKFSGKGHAAHICKTCSKLSAAEKSEAMAINRLMNLSMNHLSDSEKKWLEYCTHDKRPEVAGMSKDIYRMHFPYAERNAIKKQLVIHSFVFEVNTEVWDGYDDWEKVHQCISVDRNERKITMQDFGRKKPGQSIVLEGSQMSKLLKWMVHSLEIFMWPQDYYLTYSGSGFFKEIVQELDVAEDAGIDGFQWEDTLEERNGSVKEETGQRASWHIRINYTNDAWQDISCYDGQLDMEKAEELYFCLLEHFEEDDGFF